ncbi:MAG: acetate kinase [Clostridia bacterium]|nr:acetate kinase [Clostridia bacterium]
MNVLVVNAGSSSLKYQLIDTVTGEVKAKGLCDRIGIPGSRIDHKTADGTKWSKEIEMSNHSVATKILVEVLTDPEIGCIKDMSEIEAIGHRVVHGGPYFSESILVTDEVIEVLKKCTDFAPLHTGPHLMGIAGCTSVMPTTPQVLVFDTAFHQTMPECAYTYPISAEIAEKYQIRRYGAHGTSHRYVSGVMNEILNKEDSKVVTCHLGNGSSISAVKGGKVIDTSMGFTPLDGLVMGTRCGSIDPAIVTYVMDREGMTPDEMNNYMNKKSGFLGLTHGFSSDCRDLEAAIAAGPEDPHYADANRAINVWAYQIKKFIGSYAAAMNGLDAVVFTAGIGENNSRLRALVCENMEFYGIKIDNEANASGAGSALAKKISADDSKVAVYLIPTNEELMIAQDTARIASAL